MLSPLSCKPKEFCRDRTFVCELHFIKSEFQHQNTEILTVNLLLKVKYHYCNWQDYYLPNQSKSYPVYKLHMDITAAYSMGGAVKALVFWLTVEPNLIRLWSHK